jgi:NADH dehydrogenase FAD-containing subunit
MFPPIQPGPRTHILIIGAGVGVIAKARGLRSANMDRQTYHLLLPLLYQVVTAALSHADIAAPEQTSGRDQTC